MLAISVRSFAEACGHNSNYVARGTGRCSGLIASTGEFYSVAEPKSLHDAYLGAVQRSLESTDL